MPIIEHSAVRMPEVAEYRRERFLVSKREGATSLTIKEVELHPGWEGRLHTHPTDIAIMLTAGAVQVMLGDEIRTVRAGCTLLAPPGVPHKLINRLWVPVRLLVTYPTSELETDFLE
ncbi:MAG: cupin domain-containing protein [Chloroflexota bacterium]